MLDIIHGVLDALPAFLEERSLLKSNMNNYQERCRGTISLGQTVARGCPFDNLGEEAGRTLFDLMYMPILQRATENLEERKAQLAKLFRNLAMYRQAMDNFADAFGQLASTAVPRYIQTMQEIAVDFSETFRYVKGRWDEVNEYAMRKQRQSFQMYLDTMTGTPYAKLYLTE